MVLESLESRCLLAGDIVTLGSSSGSSPTIDMATIERVARTARYVPGFGPSDFISHFSSMTSGQAEGQDNGTQPVAEPNRFTIIQEVEPNDSRTTAQPLPLGTTTQEFDSINVLGQAVGGDTDFFRFDLRAGDILGVNVDFAQDLSIQDSTGRELIGSDLDLNAFLATGSPLPSGGLASASYVIPEDGTYYTAVTQGLGEYVLELQVYRPILESEPVGARQVIYLDFDGETLDASIFGVDQTARLSPMRDFLENWGLTAADEDAVIDAVIDHVTFVVYEHIAANGNNGDYDSTGNPGDFGVTILNSRDHSDPWGQPHVSRVIIGGTQVELFGEEIGIYGIAESIDVGNFVTNETAVVLLDTLSLPAEDDDPEFPISINTIPRSPTFTMPQLIGRVVGSITAHEVGHYFGAWHTDDSNDVLDIMDTAPPITQDAGVGPDGIAGTADDVLVTFNVDRFDPDQPPFTGIQDGINVIAFGLSTGGGLREVPGSVRGTKFHDLNENGRRDPGEPGLANFVIFADLNGNGVLDDGEPFAVTRADGSYSLNLDSGTYLIREQPRDGWRQTYPQDNRGHIVTVGDGQIVSGIDFGNARVVAGISGVVWQDFDEDGVRDEDEPGLGNVFVWADLNGDGRVSLGEPSTFTNKYGEYTLQLDPFQNYTIRARFGPGFTQTFPAQNAAQTVYLPPHTLVTDVDFGVSAQRYSFGDAPAPYPVSIEADGARHGILQGFQLGPTLGNGTFDGMNSGDGQGNPYHDGVEFLTPLIAGDEATISVDVRLGGHSRGYLHGWIDFNGDEIWDAGEKLVFRDGDGNLLGQNARLGEGTHTLTFAVPADAMAGDLVARFRYGWERDMKPTGLALAGEVEDYVVSVVGNIPRANDDTFTVDQDTVNNVFDVLENDSPSAAGGLRVQSVMSPTSQGGTAEVSGDQQTVIYTPAFGFFGSDSFEYTITDDSGNTASATVFVTVTPTFADPMAIDDQAFVGRNSSRLIDVLANDILGANPPVRINGIISGPSNGTAVVDTAGTTDPSDDTIRYTPNTNFEGVDQFRYEIIDIAGNTSQATVTVFVGDAFSDDLVRYSLEFTNTAGQPISEISVGGEFYMTVFVADVREGIVPSEMGVFSAWVDVLYDRNLVSIAGPLVFEGDYQTVPDGQVAFPGVIDGAGAFRDPGDPPPGPGNKELFRARFRAEVPGTATFLTDPANDISDPVSMPGVVGDQDTLIYSPPSVVGIQEITYIGDSITILPAGSNPASSNSEGENPLHNYVNPNDVNGDGRVNAFDVLLLVGWLHNGQPNPNGEGEGLPMFPDTNNDRRVNPLDVLSVVSEIHGRTLAARGEGEGEPVLLSDSFLKSEDLAPTSFVETQPLDVGSAFTQHMNQFSVLSSAESMANDSSLRSSLSDSLSLYSSLQRRGSLDGLVGPQRLPAQPADQHAAALDSWLNEESVAGSTSEALEQDFLEDVLKGWNG